MVTERKLGVIVPIKQTRKLKEGVDLTFWIMNKSITEPHPGLRTPRLTEYILHFLRILPNAYLWTWISALATILHTFIVTGA